MDRSKLMERYAAWKAHRFQEADLAEEMAAIEGKEEEISDRFYKMLEFGTAGLRGVIGAGTNRMNLYTVGKATAAYAKYLKSKKDAPSVAIAYDSRHKSTDFAKQTARIMAAHGVHVYLWPELMPTPSLSFAIRYYGCDGGVVVTASHNPSQYNGYKAYDATGCQLGEEDASAVYAIMQQEPDFPDPKALVYTYEKGLAEGRIELIPEEVRHEFVKACSMWSMGGDDMDKSVEIAYTPLYGTGLKCVTECLEENGFTNIIVVREQAEPNGDFPTCPYPNPEFREAMEVGLKVAKEEDSDLLIATDPDADRIGIAVKKGDDYELITGNQTGMLLLDYLCRRRTELGRMPERPVAVKSIVSTDMIYKIAETYGVEVVDVLTGFKNIAPVVTKLAEAGEADRYIFGYEESYGYMLGTHVRDKDAVSAALVIAEMFAYYKTRGQSLLEVLDALYEKYGYYLNTTRNYAFPGESGFAKMQEIMDNFRSHPETEFAGIRVLERLDYMEGVEGLPKSNVIKYILEDHDMVVLRPSGTEPKLKLYIGVSAPDPEKAQRIEEAIAAQAEKTIKA